MQHLLLRKQNDLDSADVIKNSSAVMIVQRFKWTDLKCFLTRHHFVVLIPKD